MSRTRDITNLSAEQKATLDNLRSSKNPTYLVSIDSNASNSYDLGLRFSNKTFIFQNSVEQPEEISYFSNVPITIGTLKDSINYETKSMSPVTLQINLSNLYYPEGLNDNHNFTDVDIHSGNAKSKNYLSDYIFRNKKELNLVQDEIDFTNIRTPESLIGHKIQIFLSTGNDTYIDNADNARYFSLNFLPIRPRSNVQILPLFKGYIDKVNIDLKDIKINCKDASYKLYDANFPVEGNNVNNSFDRYIFTSNYLESDDSIPEKYRNKPIPATYGIVDAAPTSIINLKRFDEFLSIAYDNYDSSYYSDIDIVSDNREHFYLNSTFDMGSSYLHDRGYLKIAGSEMYACVKQYNTEILDEPNNGTISDNNGGVFGEALAPAEGREQYVKKSGYENTNNYFSILSNNPVVALDFLELSFFNYPNTVTPYARSKETSGEAETSVMQPTHEDFIVEMGNQLHLEGSETTEIDMSPLYDGNAFTKIEYATVDIDGGASYPQISDAISELTYSPSAIGANTKQTISGFKVKFKPTGINTNYHLGFPLYKIGLNRHTELNDDGVDNWWNFPNSDSDMKELFRHRASEQSNFIGAQNKTVGIKTNISNDSSAGARGIEFMPLIEQLDLYDGLAPGNNNQQSDGGANGPSETSEYYGAQYACLVPNLYIQPNSSSIPRWLAARNNAYNSSSPTQEYNKKHFVFDNYHSWNWINLNKKFGEAYGYNMLHGPSNSQNRLRADMGASGYGSIANDGGGTKNFILSSGTNNSYGTSNSWDWTIGADDFTEFFLGCDMMITDVHKFELYNFMIFHIGVTKGIDNLDFYVNTFGRKSTNVVTESTRPIYRLYVCPFAENTSRFVNPKNYTDENGNYDTELGTEYGPYFSNGIPNSWQLDFEPHSLTELGDNLPLLESSSNGFFSGNQTYYGSVFNWQDPSQFMYSFGDFVEKFRYPTCYHRLMNRANYENIVGSVVEDENGCRMKILKVHYDKFLYSRKRVATYTPYDFLPNEYNDFFGIDEDVGWMTIKDDFSWHRNLQALPDIILVDVEIIDGQPTQLGNIEHPEGVNDEIEDYFKENLYLPDFQDWNNLTSLVNIGNSGEGHNLPTFSTRVNRDGFGSDETENDNYENRVFRYQHSLKLSDGILTKPADIVNDILFQEYKLDNFDDTVFSKESTDSSRGVHTKQGSDIDEWDLGFSITDKTRISTLLTDINLNSKSFTTYSSSKGSVKHPTIKDFYTTDQEHYTVNPNNAISFKYNRTREEDVKSSISLNYKKDYSSGTYIKSTEQFTLHDFIPTFSSYEDEYKKYYGILDNEDLSKNYISFNSDFIRNDVTAREFCRYNLMQKMNQQIIVDFEYQLFDELFTVESGDIIRFTSKPNNQNIYGIDITTINTLNGQAIYPFFMILSVEKDTSRCKMKIKAIQLHSLIHKPSQIEEFATAFPPSSSSSPDDFIGIPNLPLSDDDDTDPIPVYGCMDQYANGIGPNDLGLDEDTGAYNPDATEDDGSCQYHTTAMMGDLNLDGSLNVLDVVIMINAILSPESPQDFLGPDVFEVADMNADGNIDILDIVGLMNLILN